jgi:radical SAM protein with 4Fe4S-binding SPASM domain
MELIIAAGARHWQVQLTVAMGNAADHPELLLQPYRVLELMPVLARLHEAGAERGLTLQVGNNIGYFGPYEHLWRGFGDETIHWTGCSAGHTTLALEADGTVKGCPSLATVGFAGGNVRDLTLEEIWTTSPEIHFSRFRSVEDLWGFSRTCYYAEVCRGGCTWTSHSLLGRPGNNPSCHYRALELGKKGWRERVVKRKDAPPSSFAAGEFELITETFTGDLVNISLPATGLVQVGPSLESDRGSAEGRVAIRLGICRACKAYIRSDAGECPYCLADVQQSRLNYEVETRRRQEIMAKLRGLLEGNGSWYLSRKLG